MHAADEKKAKNLADVKEKVKNIKMEFSFTLFSGV